MSERRPPARSRRHRRPAPDAPPTPPPADDERLAIVRFKGNRKGYYHNRRGLDLAVGQFCLVEADRGRDLGRIVYLGAGTEAWWRDAVHQGVLAVAGAGDLARLDDLRREEREAREVALEKIQEHGLPMQLVGVERRWDRGKLTFYFLADGRVDFRALVRDLAGIFRTRIELRQIGVRDEARLKGGVGICGREFCCASHMSGFVSVALRMAKDQQLPLNPAKLSGPCGRLRCCLAYEHVDYQEALRSMPRQGSDVIWQGRPGKARKLDPIRELVTVHFLDDGHDDVDVPATELDFSRPALSPADGPDTHRSQDAGGNGRRRSRRRGRGGGSRS
jgi:cell fate regulator YaaT (PSP1 superfamily)